MCKYILIFAIFCGCGGEDSNRTLSGAELYEELLTADCVSGVRCGIIDASQIEACVDLEVQQACAADLSVCRDEYTVDIDEWDTCVQEMEDRACESVVSGTLPSECLIIEELL
jgi:hypothetical protein